MALGKADLVDHHVRAVRDEPDQRLSSRVVGRISPSFCFLSFVSRRESLCSNRERLSFETSAHPRERERERESGRVLSHNCAFCVLKTSADVCLSKTSSPARDFNTYETKNETNTNETRKPNRTTRHGRLFREQVERLLNRVLELIELVLRQTRVHHEHLI